MKKLFATVVLIMFLGLNVQAATIAGAVAKYKAGNYTGCVEDLNKVLDDMANDKSQVDFSRKIISITSKYDIEKIKSGNTEEALKFFDEFKQLNTKYKDSMDKWAYIFYYYALCMHQIAYVNETKQLIGQFYAAAFLFSPDSKIGEYSYQAYHCIKDPKKCTGSDIDEFIKSGKQVSDDIVKDQLKKDLEKHREEINKGKGLSAVPVENEKIAWVDAGIPEINDSELGFTVPAVNDVPTDEELGKAVRTLQKAGINPMTYMGATNEYAQLNSLLNDNSNYNYNNDYATMMMFNNGNAQMSPEVMQTLMRQQMFGSYGF